MVSKDRFQDLERDWRDCWVGYTHADDSMKPYWKAQIQQAWGILDEHLDALFADAQHYRSLQGKTDEQAS